jgi:hypothetical protein
MASKTLLLAAAVAVTFTGSATAGDFQPTSGKVTVCHRTGQKTPTGLFRGNLLTLPVQAIPGHTGHGDVVVLDPELIPFLTASGGCAINAEGDLFDATGSTKVQEGSGPTGPGRPG